MKKFRFIAYFVLAAATLGFSACQEIDDYKAGELPEGPQVYFLKDTPTSMSLSAVEDSFTITLGRADLDESLTVNLTTTMSDGRDGSEVADTLVFPASVTFDAGQPEVLFTVKYDPDLMGFDNPYKFTVAIADESLTTIYGLPSMTFTVKIPAPWKSLGTGKLYDSFFFEEYIDVDIQQNEVFPNQFRIVKPYYLAWTKMQEWGWGNYFSADLGYGSDYLNFYILDPSQTDGIEDLVMWDRCTTSFYYPGGGLAVLLHPISFTSSSDPSAWVYSAVSYYQDNGLPGEVNLAPYYYVFELGGGWDYRSEPSINILFPGVVLLDLSVELEKTGMFTDSEGAEYVAANVTLGADVEEARGVVVAGDIEADDDAFYGALALLSSEDPADYVEITADGEYKFPMPAEAEAGDYTVMVVTFNPDGEMEELDYEIFEYYPAGDANPWVSAGTVTFAYTGLFGNEDGSPYYDKGLDIEFNAAESQFRIFHALYDVTFYFSVDKLATVEFEPQYCGYDISGYPCYIVPTDFGKYHSDLGFFELPTVYGALVNDGLVGIGLDPSTEYIIFDDCLDAFEDWYASQGDEPGAAKAEAGVSIADWEVEQGSNINIGDWEVEMGSKEKDGAFVNNHHSTRVSALKRGSVKAPVAISK